MLFQKRNQNIFLTNNYNIKKAKKVPIKWPGKAMVASDWTNSKWQRGKMQNIYWKYYKYSFETLSRKGNFPRWDSNPTPLVCRTSALTARPQRIPVLLITYPSDLLCSHWAVTILFIYKTSSVHPIRAGVLPLRICSAHLSGWPTII